MRDPNQRASVKPRPVQIGPDGVVIQTFSPELTQLQRTVLELLGVPESRYR
jgi:hypothetical protein